MTFPLPSPHHRPRHLFASLSTSSPAFALVRGGVRRGAQLRRVPDHRRPNRFRRGRNFRPSRVHAAKTFHRDSIDGDQRVLAAQRRAQG